MTKPFPLIVVYIVTFRRHEMLKRAIASVLSQTYENFQVKIVNDDPSDLAVSKIIQEFDDKRIQEFQPRVKRGATSNFNLVFEERQADYVSLLEDDNWWEREFLKEQLNALLKNPSARLVVCNERLWREMSEGEWEDTGKTIWPVTGLTLYEFRIEDICGSARICNSSMLVKVDPANPLLTPESIPVDVTEHFRERLLEPQLLLNGAPLVNYAETIHTARSKGGFVWSAYQCILIGSAFAAMARRAARKQLALQLWRERFGATSPRAIALVSAGIAVREARDLVWTAPAMSLARFLIWVVRKPRRLLGLLGVRRRLTREFEFLVTAPLTQRLANNDALS